MPRLRRVEPYASPGITRRRSGRGFTYRHADGTPVDRVDRNRIADLAIPPAWEDVWIAEAPNAHILAVGVDAAGRRQYLYHPVWREKQDTEKFLRMTALAEALPGARRSVRRDLALEGLPRERVLAAAFRTLDLGRDPHRIGGVARDGPQPRAHDAARAQRPARGRRRRCGSGSARRAASRRTCCSSDPALATFVRGMEGRSPRRACTRTRRAADAAARAGRRERRHPRADGRRLHREGLPHAPRHGRRGGPARRARRRDDEARARASVREAIVHASEVLGNTPAIAKASYVDPRVIEPTSTAAW